MIIYKDYIKSKEWKIKRLKIIRERNYKCQRCGAIKNLIVHHGSYAKLGDEPSTHLFVLCMTCHSMFHKKNPLKKNMITNTKKFIRGYKPKKKIKGKKKIKAHIKKTFESSKIHSERKIKYIIDKKFKYF